MKVLSAEQIRNVDALTINMEPVTSIELMERAASACFHWIDEYVGPCEVVQVFAGPGNNGGDGLAVARLLLTNGYAVEVYMLSKSEKLSPDARINYDKLLEFPGFNKIYFLEDEPSFPLSSSNAVILDSLFGTGISRPPEGLAAATIGRINHSEALIIAIDIPSGLYAENNDSESSRAIVKADVTLSFQFPKLAFMFSENEQYTGVWHTLDIQLHPVAIELQKSSYVFLEAGDIGRRHKGRKKFSHKGTFGHAMLVAGSFGRMGAAILSAQACLRGGTGLLTTHIIGKGYEIMQISVPEAMVSIDPEPTVLTIIPKQGTYNALGIGPGIGTDDKTVAMFHQLLLSVTTPMVIDADAINILAQYPEWMSLLPPDTILTPHPGEFDRLGGKHTSGWDRHISQIKLSQQYNIIIVLKGAYTSITDRNGKCFFNSTGNPGMATGGSGDVLTGITLSLLSQGYQPIDAAITAVYLHGLAGDLAKNETGEEALIASDIIKNLGKAFKTITSTN